jgi:hypothetical protein
MNRLRILLFILVILILATSIFSFVFFHNDFFIRQWNIATDFPGFKDSRQFAWAAEAYAQGYDPLIENPVNPRGHQLNYPRIWHLLFGLEINESHTNIMGSIVVILFFIGVGLFWFSRTFDDLIYVILSIVILSPAVMLGVERSNIELVIFFIVSLALTINYYSSITALLFFVFASVLKLYPVFGFVYLLKENKRNFWVLFLSSMGVFILYALLSLDDFIQVYHTTPKLVGSSFGINVWWMGLRHSRFFNLPVSNDLALILKTLSYTFAFLVLAATLCLGIRHRESCLYRQIPYIDSFRVGAAVYIGCFLLMNTHDYRLIFLVFTVPQLVTWLRNKDGTMLSVPLVTLASMVFSLWSFFIMRFAGRKITFVLEEFSNWVILVGLLFLFFSSLPVWFSDYLRRPFVLIKR